MTIEYPKYEQLNSLTKEDFVLLAYINSAPVLAALNAMGFNYKWMEEDGVEDTIIELIEGALEYLQMNPEKMSSSRDIGKMRVELDVIDLNGDGVKRIVPALLLDVWSW